MTKKLLDCPLTCPRFRTREELIEHLTAEHESEELGIALMALTAPRKKTSGNHKKVLLHYAEGETNPPLMVNNS